MRSPGSSPRKVASTGFPLGGPAAVGSSTGPTGPGPPGPSTLAPGLSVLAAGSDSPGWPGCASARAPPTARATSSGAGLDRSGVDHDDRIEGRIGPRGGHRCPVGLGSRLPRQLQRVGELGAYRDDALSEPRWWTVDGSGVSNPAPRQASMATTDAPRAFDTIATRRPAGTGWVESTRAASKSCVGVSTRMTPLWASMAPMTASVLSPAHHPPGGSPPAALTTRRAAGGEPTPVLTATMGLTRASSRAMRVKLERGSRTTGGAGR